MMQGDCGYFTFKLLPAMERPFPHFSVSLIAFFEGKSELYLEGLEFPYTSAEKKFDDSSQSTITKHNLSQKTSSSFSYFVTHGMQRHFSWKDGTG